MVDGIYKLPQQNNNRLSPDNSSEGGGSRFRIEMRRMYSGGREHRSEDNAELGRRDQGNRRSSDDTTEMDPGGPAPPSIDWGWMAEHHSVTLEQIEIVHWLNVQ